MKRIILLLAVIFMSSCSIEITEYEMKHLNNCYKIGGTIHIVPANAKSIRCVFAKKEQ